MQVIDEISLNMAERTTLTDDIVEKLIRYIADNNLRPGDMLPSEKRLTIALGVSRLPLREALSRLRALGVISVRQGKGAFIRNVNASNIFRQLSPVILSQGNLNLMHMMEVRLALEPFVAEQAAERADDQALQALERSLEGMSENVDNRQEFVRYDIEFHRILALATANPVLDILVSTVHDALHATQFGYVDDIEARRRSLQHHRRIHQALSARDAVAASVAMEAHLKDVAANLTSDK
ncbi:MAG: FadR family transcriptional regulator [Armatimonadetes bacterium]|nr:FadR family transcriptional regulator [Armatimonadota bacterium]